MERVHPIHLVTLVVVIVGAVFAFVAMRTAFEARDAAFSAAAMAGGDNWHEIQQLQTALIRAGVIEDPTVIPDDHGDLDGPWSRCLTAEERDELGLSTADVDLPPPCDTVPVSYEERCADVVASELDEDEVDDGWCEQTYLVGRQRYPYFASDRAHPADVMAEADEWLRAESDHGVDRVARGLDTTFLHVVGEGWLRIYPDD